jgi:23S rRNA (pseudouridine1915-N3)-methyltransferase
VKILVLALAESRAKERFATEGVEDYLRRASRHVACELREVRKPEELARAIPPSYRRLYLDAGGLQPSSEELAALINKEMVQGSAGMVFVLGGAEGFPPGLPEPHLRVSLSRMTLAHRLARLVLAEQIYRALTIIRGEPYHK